MRARMRKITAMLVSLVMLLTCMAVMDPLTGLQERIGSLAIGESVEFTTGYVVTEADAERGRVDNTAAAKGYSVDPKNPGQSEQVSDTDNATVKTFEKHKLTIEYIFMDGSEASPKHEETLKEGDKYHVKSPEIEGYKPSQEVVNGTMPDRDVVITVIYVKKPDKNRNAGGEDYFTILEYRAPLGVGNVNMNVGDCYE